MVTMKCATPLSKRAFSLVEMLVVISILVVVMAIAFPAMNHISRSITLSRAGQMVADQFYLARQEAITRHQDVQVRLVWLSDKAEGPGAIQIWQSDPRDITRLQASGPLVQLPQGATISPESKISPLLINPLVMTGTDTFPGLGEVKYIAFSFRPSGETSLPFNAKDCFVTVTNLQETRQTPPANFCTVQIDPKNGRTQIYRP